MPTAKDLMTTDVLPVSPDDSVELAISRMLEHGLSSLPVVDGSGSLLGQISEYDLLDLAWFPKTGKDKVYHHMSRQTHQVAEDETLEEIAERFRTLSVRRLAVTHGGRLIGMIGRSDLLRYVLKARGAKAVTDVAAVDVPQPTPVWL